MTEKKTSKTSNSIEDYIKFWRNKIEKNKADLKKRKKMLLEYAEICAKKLKEEYNVKKVYLIGSLARNYRIHKRSDIDLVVVGLQDKKYFEALNELYKIVPKDVKIDLITKETATDSLKNIIKQQGMVI